MDPSEHEDRSSFVGGSQSPPRTLRNRDRDTILVRCWNLFLGHDREWNEQIRDGDDRGDSRRPQSITLEKVQGNLLLKQDRNINADDFSFNDNVTILSA